MLKTPSVLLNHLLPCHLASVLGNLAQWPLCSISPPTPPSSPAASRISASYVLRLASAARSLALILLSSAFALFSASRSLALILRSISMCCLPFGSKARAHCQKLGSPSIIRIVVFVVISAAVIFAVTHTSFSLIPPIRRLHGFHRLY